MADLVRQPQPRFDLIKRHYPQVCVCVVLRCASIVKRRAERCMVQAQWPCNVLGGGAYTVGRAPVLVAYIHSVCR